MLALVETNNKGYTMDFGNYTNVEIGSIEMDDYPKFCNAYIEYAEHKDGTELSNSEYNELNEDMSFVHQAVMAWIY